MEVARLRDKCSSESIESHLRVRTRCQFADYGFVKLAAARLRDNGSSESIESHLRVRTRCQFADYGFEKLAAARLRDKCSSDSNQSHLLRIRILQYLFHKERFGGESITPNFKLQTPH